MALVNPGDLLENYQLLAAADPAPSQGVFIPLASMPDLTPVEADETNGDGRKVVLALIKEVFSRYNALSDAAKPTKLTLLTNIPIGITESTVRQGFILNFDLDITDSEVSPES